MRISKNYMENLEKLSSYLEDENNFEYLMELVQTIQWEDGGLSWLRVYSIELEFDDIFSELSPTEIAEILNNSRYFSINDDYFKFDDDNNNEIVSFEHEEYKQMLYDDLEYIVGYIDFLLNKGDFKTFNNICRQFNFKYADYYEELFKLLNDLVEVEGE